MILVFIISLTLGIYAALRQNRLSDKCIAQGALISYAMPSFYLALLGILIFGVYWQVLPISGLHSVGIEADGIRYWADFAWHLVLPIGVIVFAGFGSLSLYVRNLTLEILKSDYCFFAKARGIKGWRLLRYYILPNLSPPIITMLGLSLPGLIGGSVILESIFSINGMGLLFYQSALSRDYPVIMGILIIGAFLTLLGNIIADLILLKLNPHFKKAKN